MAIGEAKQRVVARIWQSIASSGVPVNAIPKEQLDALVSAIADGVLLAVDHELAEAGLAARSIGDEPDTPDAGEKVLWEGRPFLSLTTFYRVTNERVRVQHGLFGRDFDDIELIRIQDLDRSQGMVERMLAIGDVIIKSSDPSKPQLILENVPDPDKVHELLRRGMLEARKKFRYSVQEEM